MRNDRFPGNYATAEILLTILDYTECYLCSDDFLDWRKEPTEFENHALVTTPALSRNK